MINSSVFDIIGPIMIGPSSSHTAGAVRIGRIARAALGEKPVRAEIALFGSFAKTYKGHGTDRALVAGLMGMNSDDPGIREALVTASAYGLDVHFNLEINTEYHPNTACITLKGDSAKTIFLQGSSVGGGMVIVTNINQYSVHCACTNPTLLIEHEDKIGVIGCVATLLGNYGINIAEMQVVRNQIGDNKLMVAETDQVIPANVMGAIADLPHVIGVIKI